MLHNGIPILKALVAYFRRDPVWAATRAPLQPLSETDQRSVVPALAAEMDLEPAMAKA
jgi:hypothetical protein